MSNVVNTEAEVWGETFRIEVDMTARTAKVYRGTGELAGTWSHAKAEEKGAWYKELHPESIICAVNYTDINWIYPHSLYGQPAIVIASEITDVVYAAERRAKQKANKGKRRKSVDRSESRVSGGGYRWVRGGWYEDFHVDG